RVFANGHAYHINSIGVNCDGETYLSADDLRINIWSLEDAKCCFSEYTRALCHGCVAFIILLFPCASPLLPDIVDLKPENMEDLTEVITAAELHPNHCNVFMYSTSKGTIKVGDMRKSALCDKQAKGKAQAEPDDPCDNYVLSRDYINVKLWDLRKETKPVTTIPVHQHLMSRLCDVYDNQCIYDKFECSMSWDGKHILAGSYANHVFIYDEAGETETTLDLSKMASGVSPTYPVGPSSLYPSPDAPDFAKRVLHFDWHPHSNIVAIAGLNNLFIYHA
ncbi:phr2aB, partial [Symbiodinium sp. KB8]